MIRPLVTAGYRGAVLGLLLAIGWDTSREATVLGVPHAHPRLPFFWIVGCGVGGALAGLTLAAFAYAIRSSRDVSK